MHLQFQLVISPKSSLQNLTGLLDLLSKQGVPVWKGAVYHGTCTGAVNNSRPETKPWIQHAQKTELLDC